MKKYFTFVLLSIITTSLLTLISVCYGQLTVNNTLYTPTQLVDGVLVPSTSGTVISNVTFGGVYSTGGRYQIGYFTTATTTATQMGMGSGVVLTTGHTSELPLTLGANPKASQYTRNHLSCTANEIRKGGTCPTVQNDLNVLAGGGTYYNTAILEFDFVPVSSNVSFRYIFGSEEYSDNSGLINYQCSDYSDRFGFLLSGPGVTGGQGYTNDAKNIARLSNGSIVSINSVNNGVVGSSGGGPSAAKCTAANASWVNGSPTVDYLGTIDGTQMNGNTRILTASQSGLTPGQTYHIRMIIMDLSDGAYESVVYLEASSFTTEPSPLPVELSNFTAICKKEEGVVLNFKTESERKNEYFILERASEEHPDFVFVDSIKGAGSTTSSHVYKYIDAGADLGINYYKLSQVDEDGKKTHLETIAVNSACQFDNPYGFQLGFNNETNTLTVNYDVNRQKTVKLTLVNVLGQVIQELELDLKPSEYSVKVPINQSLNSGIYLISFDNQETNYTTKLFK